MFGGGLRLADSLFYLFITVIVLLSELRLSVPLLAIGD